MALPRSMPLPWARRPIARRWCQQRCELRGTGDGGPAPVSTKIVWTSDTVRMARARVLADRQTFHSKPEIAIDKVDRMRVAGVRFGCVLADAGYGLSASFRQALSERGLKWAVGIPRHQKVYRGDVALIFPVAGRGRPRRRHIPDSKSIAAEAMLAGASCRSVSWRRGTKGQLSARFAAVRVRVADGPPQRIRDMGAQHMPGDEAWLIGVAPATSTNTTSPVAHRHAARGARQNHQCVGSVSRRTSS